MSINTPFTTVQIYLAKRGWRVWLIWGTVGALVILGIVFLIRLIGLWASSHGG